VEYCTSSGNSQNYEWISGVEVADLDNSSGASGYTDFTSLTAHLTADSSVSVALTPGFGSSSYNEYWTIWIDYNIDGDFEDSGEQVFQGYSSSTVSGSFTVPASASGLTRMRVAMQYNSYRTDPCGTFTYGEIEDYSVNITGSVVDPPVAAFTADATSITAGDSVNFTDQTTNNPTSWSWTFTGGTPSSSTAQNPTVTYNTVGTYTVSLTATNSAGSDTETKTAYIAVAAPPAPVADFTASATTINVGQSVSFTDTSTNSPTSWSWTFDGGTPGTSTSQNPSVTYNTVGTYTVSLTATNSGGSDTETKTGYITVEDEPIEYCTSSGNTQNYEYIYRVIVGSLNNQSGATGYSDFTSMSVNLTKGSSTSVSLTPGFPGSSYTEYWRIWIDYNHDGDFDDSGETVFSKTGSSTVTGSFTVPTSALSGTTRMRITMRYGGYPSSCGTFTYGEVEDYTVNIN